MAQAYVIGRVTADLEMKTSSNGNPYVRFDIAETIGNKEHSHSQYFQVCAWGDDANRLIKAHVKKGSLIWIAGSLELELFTKRDGRTKDKRMKILMDNWGFIPVGKAREQISPEQQLSSDNSEVLRICEIDGDREILPE